MSSYRGSEHAYGSDSSLSPAGEEVIGHCSSKNTVPAIFIVHFSEELL